MTDVEAGGSTVFLDAKTIIKPQKVTIKEQTNRLYLVELVEKVLLRILSLGLLIMVWLVNRNVNKILHVRCA